MKEDTNSWLTHFSLSNLVLYNLSDFNAGYRQTSGSTKEFGKVTYDIVCLTTSAKRQVLVTNTSDGKLLVYVATPLLCTVVRVVWGAVHAVTTRPGSVTRLSSRGHCLRRLPEDNGSRATFPRFSLNEAQYGEHGAGLGVVHILRISWYRPSWVQTLKGRRQWIRKRYVARRALVVSRRGESMSLRVACQREDVRYCECIRFNVQGFA